MVGPLHVPRARGARRSIRSLITLKALTYAPTGGIVAAATTSLPEQLGGVRNWDYRYCWLRDATFTLYSLLSCRLHATRRRPGGTGCCGRWPATRRDLQIMYGLAGERRLTELELDWLPGYEGSAPVRIGNAASRQFQLDVYGEVMDALHQSRDGSAWRPSEDAWRLQQALHATSSSEAWRQPDEGIWEVRGPRRHFTHSKVMAWVAFDRAVKAVEQFGLDGPGRPLAAAPRRRSTRRSAARASTRACGSFVQSYGAEGARRQPADDPAGRLPAGRRPARARARWRRSSGDLMRDGFVRPLHRRRRPSTACRRARGRSCPARSGWPTT